MVCVYCGSPLSGKDQSGRHRLSGDFGDGQFYWSHIGGSHIGGDLIGHLVSPWCPRGNHNG
jgi:hypothetical protein